MMLTLGEFCSWRLSVMINEDECLQSTYELNTHWSGERYLAIYALWFRCWVLVK